jgi:hypothetical protein
VPAALRRRQNRYGPPPGASQIMTARKKIS